MTRRRPETGPLYKVGELAQLAGVTVRTLHHYEAIGLLVPSSRTASAHRMYSRSDVERLMRITALTGLGFSLDQVRAALDDESWTPSRLIDTHLARARELLDAQGALCARLERLRATLEAGRDDVDTLFQAMEVMTMFEKYYTQDQLTQLAERRKALGEIAIHAIEKEWIDLFAQLKVEQDRGTPPDAPAVQDLARRAVILISMFTGGDAGIEAAMARMYTEEPIDKIHPGADLALVAYVQRALGAPPAE